MTTQEPEAQATREEEEVGKEEEADKGKEALQDALREYFIKVCQLCDTFSTCQGENREDCKRRDDETDAAMARAAASLEREEPQEQVPSGEVFLCRACLRNIPVRDRSYDYRFCGPCCEYLEAEAKKLFKPSPAKNWWIPQRLGLPSGRVTAPVNLWFEKGDRIQEINGLPDGVADHWHVIKSVGDGAVMVGGNTTDVEIKMDRILSHQKQNEGGQQMSKEKVTPQENLGKVKETYDRLVANGADPRAIGLWKSKLAHAEQMCKDADKGASAEAPREVSPAPQPASIRPADAREDRSQPTGFCLCGCGGRTVLNRTFLQGHDARFRSYVTKLDKGTLKLEELPEMVQNAIAENHPAVVKAREHK